MLHVVLSAFVLLLSYVLLQSEVPHGEGIATFQIYFASWLLLNSMLHHFKYFVTLQLWNQHNPAKYTVPQ